MILGVSPLALGAKPPQFLPWKSSRCVAFWDAEAPQTVVGGHTTAAPSRVNPASTDILVGAGTSSGPTLIASSIGGRPSWISNGTDQILRSTTFAFPAISGSATIFFYALLSPDTFVTSFNDMFCGGAALAPALTISNVAQITGYAGSTINVSATLGVPKRLVQRHGTPQTGADYVQWGATKVTGNMGGPGAQSGMTLFARGDLNAGAFGSGKISFLGLFTGEPTTGNLLTQLDAWGLSRYGATPWGTFVS